MQTNDLPVIGQTPAVCPGNYSPVTVTMKDSLGAIFLGILSVILLIGWRRAEGRYRRLIDRQKIAGEN